MDFLVEVERTRGALWLESSYALKILCTGPAIKIQFHIINLTSYNSNSVAVSGIVSDKVHPCKSVSLKSILNLYSFENGKGFRGAPNNHVGYQIQT